MRCKQAPADLLGPLRCDRSSRERSANTVRAVATRATCPSTDVVGRLIIVLGGRLPGSSPSVAYDSLFVGGVACSTDQRRPPVKRVECCLKYQEYEERERMRHEAIQRRRRATKVPWCVGGLRPIDCDHCTVPKRLSALAFPLRVTSSPSAPTRNWM